MRRQFDRIAPVWDSFRMEDTLAPYDAALGRIPEPVQRAVDSPRVHCQGEETYVDSRIPERVQERLRELGHIVVQQSETPAPINFARVSAVARDPATGGLSAGSSPLWNTAAVGV